MRDDASHCHIQGLRDIDPRFTVSQDGIDKLTREMTMRSPVASSAHPRRERRPNCPRRHLIILLTRNAPAPLTLWRKLRRDRSFGSSLFIISLFLLW